MTLKSGLPTPKDSTILPVGIRRVKEEGFSYLVIFPGEVEFSDGQQREVVAFTFRSYGDSAHREAWRYFSEVAFGRPLGSDFGGF